MFASWALGAKAAWQHRRRLLPSCRRHLEELGTVKQVRVPSKAIGGTVKKATESTAGDGRRVRRRRPWDRQLRCGASGSGSTAASSSDGEVLVRCNSFSFIRNMSRGIEASTDIAAFGPSTHYGVALQDPLVTCAPMQRSTCGTRLAHWQPQQQLRKQQQQQQKQAEALVANLSPSGTWRPFQLRPLGERHHRRRRRRWQQQRGRRAWDRVFGAFQRWIGTARGVGRATQTLKRCSRFVQVMAYGRFAQSDRREGHRCRGRLVRACSVWRRRLLGRARAWRLSGGGRCQVMRYRGCSAVASKCSLVCSQAAE